MVLINLLKWSPVLNDRSFPSMCKLVEKSSLRVKGLSHRNLVKYLAGIEIAIKASATRYFAFLLQCLSGILRNRDLGLKHREVG